MGRIYGGAYRGPDGIYHFPFTDDLTGERGEDLSFDPPEMFGPDIAPGAYDWQQPDPWLGVAATGAGLPQNQPIPVGFTAPGATPAEALAGARLNGQPIGPLATGLGGALPPSQYPAGMDPRRNPMSIGAGTSEQAYGYGVPGFKQAPIQIRPEYLTAQGGVFDPTVAPGYIPGSGTYNQFRLDRPGLFGEFNGQVYNARYGLGGTGDPTTGREPQTDARWTGALGVMAGAPPAGPRGGGGTGGGGYGYGSSGAPTGGGGQGGGESWTWNDANRAFSWDGSLTGQYDILPTLFNRSDTETGISTAAQGAPDVAYQILYDAIRKGVVRVNPTGWQFLQATKGVTPNQIGGAALMASNPGAGASGTGTGTGTVGSGFGEGSFQNPDVMNAITSASQMAYQRTYHEWLAKNGDATVAQSQAELASLDAYRNANLAFLKEQQQQNVGVQAATLMANLRGPANAFSAANALYGLNRTTGVPNAVAALAGEYNVPAFQAPQSLPQAASLQTLAQQLGAAGTGSGADMTTQAQQFAAGLPTPNKVVGRQYAGLSPDTQQLVLAGYESLGYSPEDTLATIKAGLPSFKAPAFGAVA